MTNTLPDSGARTEYATGAVRDSSIGKGLPSNIPPEAIRRLAKRYEDGRAKYPDNDGPNWMKGIPLSHYQDSLTRHTLSAAEGDETEDHLAAVLWNAAGWMWTLDAIERGELPASLNDLPFYKKKLDPAPAVTPVLGAIDRPSPLIELPVVPHGYHHWEPRGWGWAHEGRVQHAFATVEDDHYTVGRSGTTGFKSMYYLEAVKGPVNVGDHVSIFPTRGSIFTAEIAGISDVRGQTLFTLTNGETLSDADILSISTLE